MNKEEFLELQNEFALDVYSFEQFLKTEYITDSKYNVEFFEQILENRKIDLENKLLFESLQMLQKGTPKEQIEEHVKKAKSLFAQEKDVSYRKHVNVKMIIDKMNSIPAEEINEFEEYFKEFVLENNPIVRFNTNKEASATYELLTRLYRDCNIAGFKQVYEANNKVFLIDKEVPAEKYVEFSRLYYNTRKKFNSSVNQANARYPFNKIETLKDDASIAAERKALEEKNKSLLDINENLHKDYVSAFGVDLVIE